MEKMFHLSRLAAVLLLSLAQIAHGQGTSIQGRCGTSCPDHTTNCVAAHGSRARKSVQPATAFHALQAEGCLDVQVQQGSDGVRFEADQAFLPYLQVHLEEETLKVKIKNGTYLLCPLPGCNIKVFIDAQYLDRIKVMGSSKLVTLSNFQSRDEFLAEVSGDGNMTVTAQAPNKVRLAVDGNGKLSSRISSNSHSVEAHVQGGGYIVVAGTGAAAVHAQSVKYSVFGHGELDGRLVAARTAQTTILGSGQIWVRVSSQLLAKIYGSGTVRYFGSPRVTRHIIGSGKVIQQT